MPLLPVLTTILLLLGAGGTLVLSRLPRVRSYAHYVALATAGLATVLTLMFGWTEQVETVLSLWQPSLLFGATLVLQSDVAVQPLALALALVTCSAILVELSRMEKPRPRLASTLLALLSVELVALWSANVLTMVVSWALYDLLQATAYIAADGSARTAIRGLILGNLATVLLWAGALLSEGGADSELWPLMTLGSTQLTLWAVAGVLRLWVYPFHLSAPDDLVSAPPLATPFLLGPVMGWGLWLRLITANDGLIPGDVWMPTLAAAALALGGLLAWSAKSPRRLLPWVGMGATGAVLLAASLAGDGAATVISAGGTAWALGMASFFLGDSWRRDAPWWNIPSLVGMLTLLGAPLTLGFVTEATLFGGLMQGDHIEWGGVIFWGTVCGNLFLVPSLVRRFLIPPSSPLPVQRGLIVARGIGVGLPALLLIVAGLHPSFLVGDGSTLSLGSLFARPGLVGWLVWVTSLAFGGLLAWQDGTLRPRIELWLNAAHDLLRLEWLYYAVVGALDRGLSLFRAADEVVGGAGALLWSWFLFLLLLLVWGSQ